MKSMFSKSYGRVFVMFTSVGPHVVILLQSVGVGISEHSRHRSPNTGTKYKSFENNILF